MPDSFLTDLDVETRPAQSALRAVAFFLPQYHPVAENNAFWGPGFTEWRNVVQTSPRFRGHDQPHIPADLGFYDLRLTDTRHAQATLAQDAGLHGFCWYHYWFSGRRVLQTPFDAVLADPDYRFPFMLCWANENWTRAWDGGSSEVLLAQEYSDSATTAHARHLLPALADPRYIRIDNRPVFAVYNVDDLPDPNRWADVFRDTCLAEGIDPYLIRVERYLDRDKRAPFALGFDAALEFQPFSRNLLAWLKSRPDLKQNRMRQIQNRLTKDWQRMQAWKTFDTHHDMEAFVTFDMAQPAADYTVFPGVCPSWDNSARRPKGKSIVFRNASPALFERWMRAKVQKLSDEAPLLFINAWNEWAEGCHLEPCLRYEHQWLDALQKVVAGVSQPSSNLQK